MIEEKLINDDLFWSQLESEDLRRKNKKVVTPDMEDDYKRYDKYQMVSPKKDTIVTGSYIGIQAQQHCFNVNGFKDWVRVDNRPSENKYLKNTEVGDNIDVLITEINNANFIINGSISGIYENAAHNKLKSLDEDVVITGHIRSSNPAGYDVDIVHEGVTLAGFMPNTLAGINKLFEPESIVGKDLELMIESFSQDEGTYILSRRRYLNTLIPKAMKELEQNTVYEGHVTGTTQFGIFVEFNECLTGMIHKANVLEEWQDRISEIRPGTEIQFYVKEIVKDRIILTQIIRETLWDTIKMGQTLKGVVKGTKQFGVLVSLDQETMGLIHISELDKINKKFNQDDEVQVKIIAIDRPNRKIFLTTI